MKYETPTLDIMMLQVEDIVRTSLESDGDDYTEEELKGGKRSLYYY